MLHVPRIKRFLALYVFIAALAVFPFVVASAQTIKFPKMPPLQQSPSPATPRLAPPPRQIPAPPPYGRPVPAPAVRPVRPKVIKASPEIGINGVDPALREIRVTFDQDMNTGAYAFSGEIYYPDVTGTATWLDSRTCSLPVALAPGRFYRVGINMPPRDNFQTPDGVKALPCILYFTTVNANPLDVAALKPPQIVTLRPEMGAHGVTPGPTDLSVVFDQRMLKDISIVSVEKGKLPDNIGIGTWSADMRQLTFPARLEQQRQYIIGLNSPDQIRFENDHGVPLAPVQWSFDTMR
jgi:hypothetical protein